MAVDNGGNYSKYINAKRNYAEQSRLFGASSGDLSYDTAQHCDVPKKLIYTKRY